MTQTNPQNFLNSINSFSKEAEQFNERGARVQQSADEFRADAIRKGEALARTANTKALLGFEEAQKKVEQAKTIGEGLLGFAGLPAVKAAYGLGKKGLAAFRARGKGADSYDTAEQDAEGELPEETQQGEGELGDTIQGEADPRFAEQLEPVAEEEAGVEDFSRDLNSELSDLFGPEGEATLGQAKYASYNLSRNEGNTSTAAESGVAESSTAQAAQAEEFGGESGYGLGGETELTTFSGGNEVLPSESTSFGIEPTTSMAGRGTLQASNEEFGLQDTRLDAGYQLDGPDTLGDDPLYSSDVPPPQQDSGFGEGEVGVGSEPLESAPAPVSAGEASAAAEEQANVTIAGQADEGGAALAEGAFPTALSGEAAGDAADETAAADVAEEGGVDAILAEGGEVAADTAIGGPEITVAVLAATAIGAGLYELFGGGSGPKQPDQKPPPPVPVFTQDTRSLGRSQTITAPSENTAAHQSQATSVF